MIWSWAPPLTTMGLRLDVYAKELYDRESGEPLGVTDELSASIVQRDPFVIVFGSMNPRSRLDGQAPTFVLEGLAALAADGRRRARGLPSGFYLPKGSL